METKLDGIYSKLSRPRKHFMPGYRWSTVAEQYAGAVRGAAGRAVQSTP